VRDQVYIFEKDGTLWARKRRAGKTHYRRLETTDRGLARKRAAEWVKQLVASDWGEKPRRKFEDAVRKFSEEHMPTLAERGAERYASSIIHLLDHFRGLYLDQITSGRLSEFERARAKTVQSPTIRRDLACLSSIFTSAEEWEWADRNPVRPYLRGRKKRGLTENEPRSRFLSHDEEDAILRVCDDEMRFRISFAIDEGLRKSEQFGLEWRHLNLNVTTSLRSIRARGEVKVPKELSKSKRGRVVPLLDRSYDMLKFAERRHKVIFPTVDGEAFSTKFTSSIWESFKRAARKADVENVTWHDLRRTCGCRLLQDHRFQMNEVCTWMGHSSVKVTERHYAFLTSEALHRAVEKGRENVLDFAVRATLGDTAS